MLCKDMNLIENVKLFQPLFSMFMEILIEQWVGYLSITREDLLFSLARCFN